MPSSKGKPAKSTAKKPAARKPAAKKAAARKPRARKPAEAAAPVEVDAVAYARTDEAEYERSTDALQQARERA